MSTDAFTVLPIDALGSEYLVPAWQANNRNAGSMLSNAHHISHYIGFSAHKSGQQ